MELEIKFIDKKLTDMDKVKKLYVEVFEDTDSFISYFFEKEATEPSTTILGGFMGEKLVSVMFLRDKELVCKERHLKGCYIYGVATAPEYRGRGFMTGLMEKALESCEEKGYDIVYLIPADEKIYERFGFVTVQKREMTEIRKEELMAAQLEGFSIVPLEKMAAGEEMLKRVSEFAKNADRSREDIVIEKTPSYFRHKLWQAKAENADIYVIMKGKEVYGGDADISEQKDIVAVIITGTDDDENIYITQVICESGAYGDSDYARELIRGYPHIKPYIRQYPVMVYNQKDQSANIRIFDEV